jgi:GDP-D-mannose dehydratase
VNAPPTLITRDRQALDLTLLGDPSKAKAKLGWTPIMTTQEMCAKMLKKI